jgi:hypothetical protein
MTVTLNSVLASNGFAKVKVMYRLFVSAGVFIGDAYMLNSLSKRLAYMDSILSVPLVLWEVGAFLVQHRIEVRCSLQLQHTSIPNDDVHKIVHENRPPNVLQQWQRTPAANLLQTYCCISGGILLPGQVTVCGALTNAIQWHISALCLSGSQL